MRLPTGTSQLFTVDPQIQWKAERESPRKTPTCSRQALKIQEATWHTGVGLSHPGGLECWGLSGLWLETIQEWTQDLSRLKISDLRFLVSLHIHGYILPFDFMNNYISSFEIKFSLWPRESWLSRWAFRGKRGMGKTEWIKIIILHVSSPRTSGPNIWPEPLGVRMGVSLPCCKPVWFSLFITNGKVFKPVHLSDFSKPNGTNQMAQTKWHRKQKCLAVHPMQWIPPITDLFWVVYSV